MTLLVAGPGESQVRIRVKGRTLRNPDIVSGFLSVHYKQRPVISDLATEAMLSSPRVLLITS
jgi:hypothetical protein